MNSLLESQVFLIQQLHQDALYRLCLSCLRLDPLWLGLSEESELDPDYYEDDFQNPVYHAMLICREHFLDVYLDAIQALHDEKAEKDLGDIICEGIQNRGISLEHIDYIWWGIPLHVIGTELDSADFYANFPEVENLLVGLGLDWEEEDLNQYLPVIQILISSLNQSEEDSIQDKLAWALAWIWGITGNSCLDYTDELLDELELMPWSEENIEFAIQMQEKATEFFGKAQIALRHLSKHPDKLQKLQENFKQALRRYKRLAKKGETLSHEQVDKLAERLHLDWSFL